jgi:hypothetical protein
VIPKVFDIIFSSSDENILDPIYKMIPIRTPNHVLNRKPIHGSTSKATLVYSGCLTREKGPFFISFFLGVFVKIKTTDHIQIVMPGMRMIMEITFRTIDGPPTLKKNGNRIFRIKPTIKNGNVSSPILSPLPISAFSFIFFPSIFSVFNYSIDHTILEINRAFLPFFAPGNVDFLPLL